MTEETESTADSAPTTEPVSEPVKAPVLPPETFYQQIHDDVLALLAKLEGFEHQFAEGFKARLESIVIDVKEHI